MNTDLPFGATANRPDWLELPEQVRAAITERLGAEVTATANQTSGFSAGFASRLALDGTGDERETVFVKAAADDSGSLTDCYRLEGGIVPLLPTELPVPALRWAFDEEFPDAGQWVVLCFDDVPGQPPTRPWRPTELTDALTTLAAMADRLAAADPAPPVAELRDWRTEGFGYWRELVEGGGPRHAASGSDGRFADLAALEAEAEQALAGDAILHGDLRDDNLIVGDDGKIWICDWNWASRGPLWYDLVTLLVTAHGDGYDANALLAAHPLGDGADPDAIDAVLAGLSGLWTYASGKPPLPGSPYFRAIQTWCAEAALSWLAVRRNWV
jgi:aminoglycoside phosphotransferase (APT) family kinase protein